MEFVTLTTAAKQIGVHKSQVSRHAARLGVGRRLGTVVVLTPAELEQVSTSIGDARPGNPNRGKNGQFSARKQSREKTG